MGERVDGEGEVLDDDDSYQPCNKQHPEDIVGQDSEQQGKAHVDGGAHTQIVLVLPSADGVFPEVIHVVQLLVAWAFLQNPANVGVEQAALCVVGVAVGIHVSVVVSVSRGPRDDGVLPSSRAKEREEKPNGGRGFVGSVGKESVIAGRNGEPGQEPKNNGRNDLGLADAVEVGVQRRKNERHCWGEEQEDNIAPDDFRFGGGRHSSSPDEGTVLGRNQVLQHAMATRGIRSVAPDAILTMQILRNAGFVSILLWFKARFRSCENLASNS